MTVVQKCWWNFHTTVREHILKGSLILFKRLRMLVIFFTCHIIIVADNPQFQEQIFDPCIFSYLRQKGWKLSHYNFLSVCTYRHGSNCFPTFSSIRWFICSPLAPAKAKTLKMIKCWFFARNYVFISSKCE